MEYSNHYYDISITSYNASCDKIFSTLDWVYAVSDIPNIIQVLIIKKIIDLKDVVKGLKNNNTDNKIDSNDNNINNESSNNNTSNDNSKNDNDNDNIDELT
ncbi:hypothetical protein RhiirA5_420316 [Rhizophagus irregularis]|uniref:Uncharacterized protein n=1 Tax=Rhizophagus irregularis TaxID=588596 RepID=A0A2N0PGG3_9GLOM|nr:hypothetical protein RhiirA5_420316 [Rhizophagus irregularis]